MAFSEKAELVSVVAGTTFSSTSLYKFVVINASGHVVDPNTTGNVFPFGVLYGRTNSTSAAGNEAVPVAYAGVVKVKAAASTLSHGQFIGASTAGFAIAPTTDAYTFGTILKGSSGAAGRIISVLVTRGPLSSV